MTPQRKTSYHRLAFGARTGSQGPPTPNDDDDEDDEVGLDQLEISEVEPKMNKVNSTFEKKSGTSRTNLTYDNCDDQSNLLNGTFDKVIAIIFNDVRYPPLKLTSTFQCPLIFLYPGAQSAFELNVQSWDRSEFHVQQARWHNQHHLRESQLHF